MVVFFIMHRASDLWPAVTSFENLYRAAYQVFRGKRNQVCAGEFFGGLEKNLFNLQRELLTREYRPGPYRTFWIIEPKPRMISAASLRDRVVHHALVNVIEPVFERRFIEHSYACRTGKGTHKAITRFVEWSRSSRYVLKLDIRKFFPTIDHEVLKERIRRAIKDADVLWLCDLIIDNSNEQERVVQHYPGDDLLGPIGRRCGIPIGNLTSQFFANVHLDALDHHVKERLRLRRYIRYVDDFCIFHDDRELLQDVRQAIRDFLLSLRLRLNERKSRIRQVKEGVEFLGFVVTPHQIRLNQTSVRRQRRRIRTLQGAYTAGVMGWPEVTASLQAWDAHAAFGTTRRLREDVFQHTRFQKAPSQDSTTALPASAPR